MASEFAFPMVMRVFESGADVIHYDKHQDGKWHATIEAADSGQRAANGPEQDIRAILSMINGFDDAARREWSGISSIDFNIGWQAATERPEGRYELSAKLLL